MGPRQMIRGILTVGIALAAGSFGVAISSYGQGRGLQPLPFPTVDQQAETAFNAFEAEGNPDKKIKLGEEFELNFHTSRYQEAVAGVLVTLYYNKEDWVKFYATAHAVLAEDPDNTTILELVGYG